MKKINWKIILITVIITLSPIIVGIAFYKDLPNNIAIHFDINNNPDRYASKNFALFCLPMMTAILQIICCIINDINANYKGKVPKFELVVKSIIPAVTIIMYVTTLLIALGNSLEVSKIAVFMIGVIIMLVGNYLPKITYIQTKYIHPQSLVKNKKLWNKTRRMQGYTFVVIGFLLIISIIFPTIYSIICLIVFVLALITQAIYTTYLLKKQKG